MPLKVETPVTAKLTTATTTAALHSRSPNDAKPMSAIRRTRSNATTSMTQDTPLLMSQTMRYSIDHSPTVVSSGVSCRQGQQIRPAYWSTVSVGP